MGNDSTVIIQGGSQTLNSQSQQAAGNRPRQLSQNVPDSILINRLNQQIQFVNPFNVAIVGPVNIDAVFENQTSDLSPEDAARIGTLASSLGMTQKEFMEMVHKQENPTAAMATSAVGDAIDDGSDTVRVHIRIRIGGNTHELGLNVRRGITQGEIFRDYFGANVVEFPGMGYYISSMFGIAANNGGWGWQFYINGGLPYVMTEPIIKLPNAPAAPQPNFDRDYFVSSMLAKNAKGFAELNRMFMHPHGQIRFVAGEDAAVNELREAMFVVGEGAVANEQWKMMHENHIENAHEHQAQNNDFDQLENRINFGAHETAHIAAAKPESIIANKNAEIKMPGKSHEVNHIAVGAKRFNKAETMQPNEIQMINGHSPIKEQEAFAAPMVNNMTIDIQDFEPAQYGQESHAIRAMVDFEQVGTELAFKQQVHIIRLGIEGKIEILNCQRKSKAGIKQLLLPLFEQKINMPANPGDNSSKTGKPCKVAQIIMQTGQKSTSLLKSSLKIISRKKGR